MTDSDAVTPAAVTSDSDTPASDTPITDTPDVVGFDLGDETAAEPPPLSFDVDWDAASAAASPPADSWLDLQPEPTPVVPPSPNWPLGSTSVIPASAGPAPAGPPAPAVPTPAGSASPVPSAPPIAQPTPQAPTYEVYNPSAAPYTQPGRPAARPIAGHVPSAHSQQLAAYPSPAVSSDSTTWASAAHWSGLVATFVTGGALGFLGPLIVNASKGSRDPFIRAHAVEALNFQLTMLICIIISAIAVLIVVGFVGLIAFPILTLVCSIMGALAAGRGEAYRYPINFRMIK